MIINQDVELAAGGGPDDLDVIVPEVEVAATPLAPITLQTIIWGN